MEYNSETNTVSFKSSPYHFGKECENKHYTCRLMTVDEYAILADNPVEYIEIQCNNSKDRIFREVIDITTMGDILGHLIVGIGWKAPEGSKMSKQQEPKIAQSPLTREWYIATEYTESANGVIDAETKHIIPKHVIANIAWDYLLREQMKDCNKGFETIVNTPTDGAFLVSVSRSEDRRTNE